MAAKKLSPPRFPRSTGLVLATTLVGTAGIAAFAQGDTLLQAWRAWKSPDSLQRPYSYGTSIRLLTKRNHIDVYDMRRSPTLIHSLDVAGQQDLTVQYTCPPGKQSDTLELRSGSTEKVLLRLNLDGASEATVDARWPNLYEVESGSQLNMTFGDIVRFQRSGFTAKSASLLDSSAASPAVPLRIVIRPDMSSPLWQWGSRIAMRGDNDRYYLSAFHTAGVPATELTAAIARNPPRD